MARADWPNVTVAAHPLVAEHLIHARDRHATVEDFRTRLRRIAELLVIELLRDAPVRPWPIDTPHGPWTGSVIDRAFTIVPILRAGLPLAEAAQHWLPAAPVGHLGIYRDAETLEPVVYYNKLPPGIAHTQVILFDVMLATGGSINRAIDIIKQTGAREIALLCVIASPQGLDAVSARHPDVHVVTGAIDQGLDERGHIVPGLGDAGDRLFATA